jgi:O-antigen ligase
VSSFNPAFSNTKHIYLFTGLSILWIAFTFVIEKPILSVLPIGIPFALLISRTPQILLFALWTIIPFSFDLPITSTSNIAISEPILLGLLLLTILLILYKKPRAVSHYIVGILILQWIWQIALIPNSVNSLLSTKYVLAKTWFYAGFLFFPILYLDSKEKIRLLLEVMHYSLLSITLLSVVRHGILGFGFDTINPALRPFFRNHVIYAAILSFFFPFSLYLYKTYQSFSIKKIAMGCAIIIYIFAIVTSYTRTAWLAVPIGIATMVALHWRVLGWSLIVGVIGIIVGSFYFIQNDNYLNYAPDYESTIFNEGNIQKHLEATYQLKDVSGMERIYRWVAAKKMIADKPWMGSGPNTFYPEYKQYTVTSFTTYVSDNPEKSTTHNYFLMMLAEQGIIGFILFITGIIYAFTMGIRNYTKITDPDTKRLLACTLACFSIFIFNLFLSDLIEVDKTGGFYFFALALLIIIDKYLVKEKV